MQLRAYQTIGRITVKYATYGVREHEHRVGPELPCHHGQEGGELDREVGAVLRLELDHRRPRLRLRRRRLCLVLGCGRPAPRLRFAVVASEFNPCPIE